MKGGQIAIDGKALRVSRVGSCPSPLCFDFLAQAFVGEKTNEITAIPELLEMLNLKGAVVTLDAMGTQRAIAGKIVHKGGHSILRRMALNAHNRMSFEGKKRKSLPKRELRATHDSEYLEQRLSLI